MNWAMFDLGMFVLSLVGVLLFLAFRFLSKNKGQMGIIIYVMGNICLAISIYGVGIMVVDILISDYFKSVDNYSNITMWTMIVVALGLTSFIAMIDPIAANLRKGGGKILKDIPVKDLPDYKAGK
jgi:hypothetical protein